MQNEIETYIEGCADILNSLQSENDRECVMGAISQLVEKGYTLEDVRKYIVCTEHVNPSLSEESALRRMKEISDNYTKILSAEQQNERMLKELLAYTTEHGISLEEASDQIRVGCYLPLDNAPKTWEECAMRLVNWGMDGLRDGDKADTVSKIKICVETLFLD